MKILSWNDRTIFKPKIKKISNNKKSFPIHGNIIKKLDEKFPSKEEESLRALSDIANRLGVQIIAIKPGQKNSFLDADKKPVKLAGRVCQKIWSL